MFASRRLRLFAVAVSAGMALTVWMPQAAQAARPAKAVKTVKEPPHAPRIGLVLSGGGARGFAHVGILKVLEECNIIPYVVTATSMGSLVGGSYALGYSPSELEGIINGVNWKKMFAMRPSRSRLDWQRKSDDLKGMTNAAITVGPNGVMVPTEILPTQNFDTFLHNVTLRGDKVPNFAELPVKFACMATNLETGQLKVFDNKTPIAMAMRASMSVPAVFKPVEIDGKLYCDGGLVRNLPVDIARRMGADIIIAVNVGTPLSKRSELGTAFGVAGQMVNILTEQNVARSIGELTSRDILITPDLEKYSSADFAKSAEIIQVGEKAARKVIERLRRLGASEEAFDKWEIARQGKFAPQPTFRIAEVDVTKNTKISRPEAVIAMSGLKPGDVVTRKDIANGVQNLWASGDFESVRYTLEDRPDGKAVIFDTTEYQTARFRLAAQFQGNTDGDYEANLSLIHDQKWINRWGATWRNELQLGTTQKVSTKFTQPLGLLSPWSVQPRAGIERVRFNVWDSDRHPDATGRLYEGHASVRLRRNLANWGIGYVEAGYLHDSYENKVGNTDFSGMSSGTGFAAAGIKIDTLDDASFPKEGFLLVGRGAYLNHSLLPGRPSHWVYDWEAKKSFQVGEWNIGGSARGGVSSAEGHYRLGGFFNLTGSRLNRFCGNEMLYGRLHAQRNISRMIINFDYPLYTGFALEAGRVKSTLRTDDPEAGRWHLSESVFIGTDTFFGPLYLSVGHTVRDDTNIQLYWGKPL